MAVVRDGVEDVQVVLQVPFNDARELVDLPLEFEPDAALLRAAGGDKERYDKREGDPEG